MKEVECIRIKMADNGFTVHVTPKHDPGTPYYDDGTEFVFESPEKVLDCVKEYLPDGVKEEREDRIRADSRTIAKVIDALEG